MNAPIILISGPSGAGEDSVIEGLQQLFDFNRIVTTVTRKPRAGESEGHPYYFISEEEFKQLIDDDQLIEWAIVYDDYRGCTKAEIQRLQAMGKPILWKVDWQGVQTIKAQIPDAISIFIAPPSYEALEQRLSKRGIDSEEEIHKREAFTREWLKHKDVYDHIIINEEGKLDRTIQQAREVIQNILN